MSAELEKVISSYQEILHFKQQRKNVFLLQNQQPKILKMLSSGAQRGLLTGKIFERGNGAFTPKLTKTPGGQYYLWRRGNRYLLTAQLPGREADYLNLADLQVAIRTMRTLHGFARENLDLNSGSWKGLWFDPLKTWQTCLLEMEKCRKMAIRMQNDWSRRYLSLWYHFSDLVYQCLHDLRNLNQFSNSTLCYHDWACHNLIINHDQGYLFDFDYMLIDHPAHDRSNLIGRYLRLYRWSAEALLKILWNFDRYYHWYRGELQLLRIYLTFPYDYWMIGRQYFIEKQPWSERYYEEQWERKISQYKAKENLLNLLANLE